MERAFQRCVRDRREDGVTVLLSSHIMGEVESLADRVSLVRRGRTVTSGYAAAVTAGNALLVINGKVEGIDSLGGVIADEFGFMAAFLLPLLGISLVARATRREVESGRIELLLGGRIARHQPTLAALLVATTTIGITGALFAAGLIGTGVPVAGSLLYAASLGSLACVFAGVAALLAQLTLHARGVYTWSLTSSPRRTCCAGSAP